MVNVANGVIGNNGTLGTGALQVTASEMFFNHSCIHGFIIVYSFDFLDFQPNAALTLIGATSVTAPSLDLAFLQYGAGASIYNPDIITNLFEND